MTVVWVDASSGASGDMLLGALLGAGVPLEVVRASVDAVAPEPVTLGEERVMRAGFAATRCHVEVTELGDLPSHHRTWRDIRAMLLAAPLSEQVRDLALTVFERLAVAEATVHGSEPMDVHFHEVGALDAIADVVGVCAGFVALGADQVVVSPVAVGSGSVRGAHGTLPVPPPAVAQLLRGVPSYAGPDGAPAMELCTPTGAALLTTLATSWGPQPPMTTREVGVGAGGRDPEGHANVLRMLVGQAAATTDDPDGLLVLETNVDDLDPRVWPEVITSVLAAGALDAWLTPILMKKGRPAHTFRALVEPGLADEVRRTIFRETSTIGIRTVAVERHALPRETTTVQVGGIDVPVKVARLDGQVVNAQPEYDDVVRVAAALDRPVAAVLAEAKDACRGLIGEL